MFKLRDYQNETIENIQESLVKGNKSIVVQYPPRSGKTVIMAEIARRTTAKGNRVLFIVHRKEIIQQVKATFKEQGVDSELCTVGMVQTLTRKVNELKPPNLILIDEAHHVLARSYLNIIEHFPKTIRLMFTGTPYRLSGKGFEDVADDLIEGHQVSWLIKHNRLSPVDYYAPKFINVNELKTNHGEYTNNSIDDAMKPKIYGNAVKNYQKIANGTNAIAYCHNVQSAKKLAAAFDKVGISSVEVDGSTEQTKRDEIIKQFKNGKIKVLTNVELFTEGLDLPGVDTVIQLRPTKSLSLFLQFSMRSMNYRPDKRAIIIDHVGNVEKFGLPTDERHWSLKGKNKSKSSTSEQIKPVTVCNNCFATFYRTNNFCPFCNAILTDNSNSEIAVDNKAELKKITERKNKRVQRIDKIMQNNLYKEVAGKTIGELHSMKQLKAFAELHGYKKGWSYMQGKRKGIIKK